MGAVRVTAQRAAKGKSRFERFEGKELPVTLVALAADNPDKILEIYDERSTGGGIWIYLKPGYHSDGNSAVHEDTVRECIEQFSYVEAD